MSDRGSVTSAARCRRRVLESPAPCARRTPGCCAVGRPGTAEPGGVLSVEEDRKRTHAPSSLDLFSMVTPRRRNNLPEMAQLFRAATVKSANTVLRCGATACVQRQDVCSCAFILCLAVNVSLRRLNCMKQLSLVQLSVPNGREY